MAEKKKKEKKPVEKKSIENPAVPGKLETYKAALEYIRDFDMSKAAMTEVARRALEE